jgi:hypothetical protein
MILSMKGEVGTNLYSVRAQLVNTSVLKPQRVSKMLIWIFAILLRFLTMDRRRWRPAEGNGTSLLIGNFIGWDPFRDLATAMCLQETGRRIHLHNRFFKGVQDFTRAVK